MTDEELVENMAEAIFQQATTDATASKIPLSRQLVRAIGADYLLSFLSTEENPMDIKNAIIVYKRLSERLGLKLELNPERQ